MDIRPAVPEDREGLAKLLDRIENFSAAKRCECALEVIDLALQPSNPDYQVLVALIGMAARRVRLLTAPRR